MDKEIIKITCPNCESVLSIKVIANLEEKSVICPLCKCHISLTEFIHRSVQTTIDDKDDSIIGQLIDLKTNEVFPLAEGTYLVGRKSDGSSAKIQISDFSRRMSREHFFIDLKTQRNGRIIGQLLLHNPRVNPVNIGFFTAIYGRPFLLKNDDVIRIGEKELKLRIFFEDEDRTLPY